MQTIRCDKTNISFEFAGCYSHQHANVKDVAYFDDSTDFAGIRQKVKKFFISSFGFLKSFVGLVYKIHFISTIIVYKKILI